VTSDDIRAWADAAKSGVELVKATGGVGSYLADVVGSLPHNAVGLIGDWVDHVRQRNQARLQARTAEILSGIARERITEPSPSVVQPLLEAARNESRESLQQLWANLLANAMLDGGNRVRRDFFDVLAKMEPADAAVLDFAERLRREIQMGDAAGNLVDQIHSSATALHLSNNDVGVSIDALVRLGCFVIPGTLATLRVTPFGIALVDACRPPV
jgi:hypothetical protein